MKEFEINNLDSLSKAADQLHDAGFTKESIGYDKLSGIFSITAKQYEYTGKILQKKTNVVKGESKLILFNIKACDIFETDKKGYQTVGEDYLNDIKIKDDKILVIRTAFHEIRLEFDILSGTFEYSR